MDKRQARRLAIDMKGQGVPSRPKPVKRGITHELDLCDDKRLCEQMLGILDELTENWNQLKMAENNTNELRKRLAKSEEDEQSAKERFIRSMEKSRKARQNLDTRSLL